MKVTYTGPSADLDLADGQIVERGDTVDVDADLGKALIASGDFIATKKDTKTEEVAS